MPIHVPITFPRLSEAEMLEVDYDVMKHAFACHRELGRLCDELNYQADLARGSWKQDSTLFSEKCPSR
jgi:hypothetical protein